MARGAIPDLRQAVAGLGSSVGMPAACGGCWNSCRRYRRSTTDDSDASVTRSGGPILTERDLERLPAAVAPVHLPVRSGRQAAGRVYPGHATMAHLPVDVLHVFTGDSATMRVKLGSLVPMVNTTGPELTRAETVTLLNDLCVLPPAALPDAGIVWTPMGDHQARATFTRAGHTVTADLIFDEQDRLVDFTSDDRYRASSDGNAGSPRCATTGPSTAARSAAADAAAGARPKRASFAYLEVKVDDITYGGFGHHQILTNSATDSTATVAAGIAVTVENAAVEASGGPTRP